MVRKSGLELPSYILSALTAAGGAIGYARTKSKPSLIAGTAVGLLYGLGGYRISNNEPYGVELSLLASLVLGGSAFPRAFRLRKPVPILLSMFAAYGLLTFGDAFRRAL
ncbi:Transmembrane protein 14 [Madurella mycetomatis]|uniref:Transmembrane protein 14 n=1 Tax=Madurella mycetomatis TaxID=100816 RepID=A0A175VVC2_9PEZI|nr:Transmembrane protein 14 [Madurella mycetomatis]